MELDIVGFVENKLKESVVDYYEKASAQKSAEKAAMDGLSAHKEYLTEGLNKLMAEIETLDPGTMSLTKESIRSFYEDACDRIGFSELKEDQECYKRFSVFVAKYLKFLINKLSEADRLMALLEEEQKNADSIDTLGKAMAEDNRITKDKLDHIIENEHKVLDMLKEKDIQIVIPEGQRIAIEPLSSRYLFYNNCFDFEGKHPYDEDFFGKEEFVLSFLMQNVGSSRITELEVSNLSLYYCYPSEEIEQYFYLSPVADYNGKTFKKQINIVPLDRKSMHLVFRNIDPKPVEDDDIDIEYECYTESDETEYAEPDERTRLYITFNMKLTGDSGSVPFAVDMYVSRKQDRYEIEGDWTLDMIVYSEIKQQN